jgi:hypothetical protein
MKPKAFAGIFLLLLACCFAVTAQEKPEAKTDYAALLERVKSGDQTVDFRQLRLAYANSPSYGSGPDTDTQRKAMMASLNAKDFANAIKNADVVLAAKYVDLDAHFVAYVAHRELKDTEQAEFHKFVLQGMLKSITASGDGKSPETAFQVIEVHEEYVLLRFMGVGLPESQALLHKNGHSYDEVKFKDPASKQEATLYFNVDIPIKHGL